MNRKNDDLEHAARLARGLREYKAAVREMEEAKRKAEEALDTAREDLLAAERFYEMELKRLGLKAEQVRLPLEEKARFMGMSPREACTGLLKERGEMTLEELVQELIEGGFEFRGRSPRRTVNMALMGREDIERLEGGRFRYVGKGS